jgi:hypothetical protein
MNSELLTKSLSEPQMNKIKQSKTAAQESDELLLQMLKIHRIQNYGQIMKYLLYRNIQILLMLFKKVEI